jgi:hypothetical protein
MSAQAGVGVWRTDKGGLWVGLYVCGLCVTLQRAGGVRNAAGGYARALQAHRLCASIPAPVLIKMQHHAMG